MWCQCRRWLNQYSESLSGTIHHDHREPREFYAASVVEARTFLLGQATEHSVLDLSGEILSLGACLATAKGVRK